MTMETSIWESPRLSYCPTRLSILFPYDLDPRGLPLNEPISWGWFNHPDEKHMMMTLGWLMALVCDMNSHKKSEFHQYSYVEWLQKKCIVMTSTGTKLFGKFTVPSGVIKEG